MSLSSVMVPALSLPRLVLVPEIADAFRVSQWTVNRWDKQGLIKLQRYGRKKAMQRSELERILREGIAPDTKEK